MIYYAIGDIHGQSGLLDSLLAAIEADAAARPGDKTLVYLGDYVDRGPDSAGVLDRLIAGPPPGIGAQVALLGNHEDYFIDYFDGVEPAATRWMEPDWNGGVTLASYQGDWQRIGAHVAWLRGLPLYWRSGPYLFVHAGIFPGRPLPDQRRSDLIWIRDRFLNDPRDHGFVVVHGHTPPDSWDVDWLPNRINADSGAGYGGPLSCVVLGDGDPQVLQAFPEDAPDASGLTS
jgi:serine/threonine protein phosphatase 1